MFNHDGTTKVFEKYGVSLKNDALLTNFVHDLLLSLIDEQAPVEAKSTEPSVTPADHVKAEEPAKKETVVTIYTDGACSGNPGPGGWGYILMLGGHKKEGSGSCEDTTNNKMELTAVIEALQALKKPVKVEIFSDSAYVVNGFSSLDRWKLNGWRTASKGTIANLELWQQLDELVATKTLGASFTKVKGHSDNEFNNRCDELATAAIKSTESSKEVQKDEKAA